MHGGGAKEISRDVWHEVANTKRRQDAFLLACVETRRRRSDSKKYDSHTTAQLARKIGNLLDLTFLSFSGTVGKGQGSAVLDADAGAMQFPRDEMWAVVVAFPQGGDAWVWMLNVDVDVDVDVQELGPSDSKDSRCA